MPLSEPTATGGGDPRSIDVTPSGKFAYTVGAGEIGQYNVAADGALTSMNTATAATVLGTTPAMVVVASSGKYAYVLNGSFDNSVSHYSIGQNGALTLLTPATVSTGANPGNIIVHPSGKYIYVINYGDSNISQFGIGANGALAPLSPATEALPVAWLSFDLSGQYAYGAATWNSPDVLLFKVSQGLLSALGTATTLPGSGLFGKMVFAKKSITSAGTNTGVVSNHPQGCFHCFTTSDGTTPAGGTSSGIGPYTLNVSSSPGFNGWITDGGVIDCNLSSINHTTCSATLPNGSGVVLHVAPTNAGVYNVTWSGDCKGTNFTTSVSMNTHKTCLADLIPCTGNACTSH
jgi:hypothetical protein